ncbi:MAG: hypothetical protein WCT04_06895 [Planctomycetota bacterium]
MLNGRHLILLGGIAAAGLVSVREGQRQVSLCYQIATVEKEIRSTQADIKLCKNEHLSLQSPKAMMEKATQLRLPLAPIPAGAATAVIPQQQNTKTNSSSGNRHAPLAPAVPTLPTMPLQERP